MQYRFVPAPAGYPGRVYKWGKRVLEHHRVWWEKTGELVPEDHVLHHRNGDGLDNRFENLELKERGRHTTEHLLQEPPVELECAWCGKPIVRPARDVRSKRSQGQHRFFCCSSHAAKARKRKQKPITHGTYSGYRRGCRCDGCRRANTDRARKYRNGELV
jgi:hypothetical protein